MFTQQFLVGFLMGQKRELLAASASSELAPILLEAGGYAGGKKVTQFLETINKALHIGGHGYDNWRPIREIVYEEQMSEQAKIQALMAEVRASLRLLGMKEETLTSLLRGLDQAQA
jgi:hypothetical protein